MKKVLIAYYNFGETTKVADKIERLLVSKNLIVEKLTIKSDPELSLKEQFKNEKKIILTDIPKSIGEFDLVIIGTPVASFSSAPIVNVFLRSIDSVKDKKFVLFATGIGLPGNTIKKMQGILSINGAVVADSQMFSSIFDFDERKLAEVEPFVERFLKKTELC